VSVRLHRWTLAMSLILFSSCIAFAFPASLGVYSWLQVSERSGDKDEDED
jgi:hypothetical protein